MRRLISNHERSRYCEGTAKFLALAMLLVFGGVLPVMISKKTSHALVADKASDAPTTQQREHAATTAVAATNSSTGTSQQAGAGPLTVGKFYEGFYEGWPNLTTAVWASGYFYSGYRNQMNAFTMFVFETTLKNSTYHGQILVDSLQMKDTYGTNLYIPFQTLWDVSHWNTFHPRLPRLVSYSPKLNLTKVRRPQGAYFAGWMRYSKKRRGPYAIGGHRNPTERLMYAEAMRPAPRLQELIDGFLQSLVGGGGDEPAEYMTLHARVEPDMQRHPVCRDMKVLNLTDIFDFIETKWPEPPARHIFMPINRDYLEKEGSEQAVKEQKNQTEVNWIAVANLKALNKARDEGLWNGRVKVFEFGAQALQGTEFAERPSTTGAMVNFFLGMGANIFVGTEVSTFSVDLMSTRFYKNNTNNYKYLPEGLVEWTPPGTVDPPGFGC